MHEFDLRERVFKHILYIYKYIYMQIFWLEFIVNLYI